MADSNSSGGIGFVGALTILFVGLKLTNYISWPWLWVLSPIWISAALVGGVALIIGGVLLIGFIYNKATG